MKPLSIIIPIYNEELILEKEVVSIAVKMAELLPDLDYELLLVENGSFDRTPQIAQKIAETNSRIRVLSLPIASYGKAMKEGVFNSEAEFLTIFNIDFWDIGFIRRALPLLERGIDIVVGSKAMKGSVDKRSFLRRFITKSFNLFLRFFFGFKGSDTHGIKIFNRAKIIPVLKQCKTDREIFDTELLLRAQKAGLLKKEIPVSCEEKRKSAKSLLKRIPKTVVDLLILFWDFRIQKRRALIFLLAILVFLNVFSLGTLTTKPAVWYDEGINIELARNFSEFGKLDLITEPLTFSGRGAIIGSTGYPVTIPLALFFKIFGFGFAQARIYMLLWMTFFIICLFYFLKKQWGENTALIVTSLIATFPAFYGNGRSVMGEIPGFIFILLTFIWYLYKNNIFISGIFLGLAVICKPSVYIFFIPAFAILFFLNKENVFKKIAHLGLGSVLPFSVWGIIYSRTVLSAATWQNLWGHFVNPYQAEGMTSLGNIRNNLIFFFHSPTLIYFSLFTLAILAAIYFNKEFYRKNRNILLISGFYSFFSFLFFLKSLGYLRYLIAVQFLIFIFLVPSMKIFVNHFFTQRCVHRLVFICFVLLILFQMVYLFSRAKLFYSDEAQATFQYLEDNFNRQTIGIINIPPLASLLPPERKFHAISTYGLRNLGRHPLSFKKEELLAIIVLVRDQPLEEQYKATLAQFYRFDRAIGHIMIYEKQDSNEKII